MSEPRTTAVVNIGTLYTGDLAAPIAEADSLLIDNGQIAAVGGITGADADRVVDVNGATVGPGLIDSHCHVVLGDFTPRQNTVGFLYRKIVFTVKLSTNCETIVDPLLRSHRWRPPVRRFQKWNSRTSIICASR